MSVKSGKCIKTGALIKVLEYGFCQMANIYQVDDSIIIHFGQPLFEGTRSAEPTGYEVFLGLRGFYHEKLGMIVVPVDQFTGQVYPEGSTPVMYPEGAVTRKKLEQELARLEKLRPHWAQGHTNDGVAAQVHLTALLQLWEILGVNDQTAAVTKLKAITAS